MIISASRRTDIPSFYLDWLLNRIKEGYVLVRNPMNFHQVSRVSLLREDVDCLVFWTKNPFPMLEKLNQFAEYPYYIQFTINPYGREMEKNLPGKEILVDTFKRLADTLGQERLVWRYSPVLINKTYSESLHYDFFGYLSEQLCGYTNQCNLSFLDMYTKIKRSMVTMGVEEVPYEKSIFMAQRLSDMGKKQGIQVCACGHPELLSKEIQQAKCIDPERIYRITGKTVPKAKDFGQRKQCACAKSVDVGAYHTCLNGCMYCYANTSLLAAKKRWEGHSQESPILCGDLNLDDKVTMHRGNTLKKVMQPNVLQNDSFLQLPLIHNDE